MESTPVILLLLNVAVVPGGQQGRPKRIGAVFLESRTPVKRSFLWGWHDPRIRDFPERVTRLFPGSRVIAFFELFAGKRFPNRLVIHAVDCRDLRRQSIAVATATLQASIPRRSAGRVQTASLASRLKL
jgi:hypothetical protein